MSGSKPKRRANGTFLECGNYKGRPRKSRGVKVDAKALLFDPIRVRDSKGVERDLSPYEIGFRQHVKKAPTNVRSAIHVLDQFWEHGAIARPITSASVIVCPPGLPLEVARVLVEQYGAGPWSARQIAAARKRLGKGGAP